MKYKTILVTGGAGFIGSNFIRYLLNKYPYYKVVNLDKLTYAGNLENLKDIESNLRYKFIKGDICDEEAVKWAIKGCDFVVNFAAQTHVDRSIADAGSFIKTNVYGVYVLLKAARKYGVKRFLQIATDEVYGSIQKGSFTEESSLTPNSPYAASKASADLLCRSYFITHKFPVLISRSSNNFGPFQYPEKIIPLFVTNILEGKKVPLYGNGKNIRDWLFVEDNCRAIDSVLHKGKIGEVYNIGGGNEIDNLKLANLLLRRLKKPKSFIRYVKDRPGHDKRYSLEISKIKSLGWMPAYNFEQSLDLTIKWYKDNQRWWKKLK